jgi:branched-chain amino acid transport system permease protein
MVYHLQLSEALGPKMPFLGATLDAKGFDTWFGAAMLVLVGVALFELARRSFSRQWGEIQTEIEIEIKRREAL